MEPVVKVEPAESSPLLVKKTKRGPRRVIADSPSPVQVESVL